MNPRETNYDTYRQAFRKLPWIEEYLNRDQFTDCSKISHLADNAKQAIAIQSLIPFPQFTDIDHREAAKLYYMIGANETNLKNVIKHLKAIKNKIPRDQFQLSSAYEALGAHYEDLSKKSKKIHAKAIERLCNGYNLIPGCPIDDAYYASLATLSLKTGIFTQAFEARDKLSKSNAPNTLVAFVNLCLKISPKLPSAIKLEVLNKTIPLLIEHQNAINLSYVFQRVAEEKLSCMAAMDQETIQQRRDEKSKKHHKKASDGLRSSGLFPPGHKKEPGAPIVIYQQQTTSPDPV